MMMVVAELFGTLSLPPNLISSFTSSSFLARFIAIGGYRLLNSWLTHSKSTSNSPLLHLILLTLQNLPLRVEHLKQVTSPFRKGISCLVSLI